MIAWSPNQMNFSEPNEKKKLDITIKIVHVKCKFAFFHCIHQIAKSVWINFCWLRLTCTVFFVASRSRFVPIRSLSHHQVCDFWELIICCNYHYCTDIEVDRWAAFVRSLARIEMIFQLRTQTSIRRWCAMVLWSDPIRSEIVNVQHCTYHSEIDSRPNVYFFYCHSQKQTNLSARHRRQSMWCSLHCPRNMISFNSVCSDIIFTARIVTFTLSTKVFTFQNGI